MEDGLQKPLFDQAKELAASAAKMAPEALGAIGGGMTGGLAGAGTCAVVGAAVAGPGGAAIGFLGGFTVGTLGGAAGGTKLAGWMKKRSKTSSSDSV
jgi:hypothetical protein